MSPRIELFLDSSYAIVLSAPKDALHHRARAVAQKVRTAKLPLVTTRAVLVEIGNGLSKQLYRPATVRLLKSLESDKSIEIVPLSDDLYHQAFQLYTAWVDKEWGLTDCISFVVMRERGIFSALIGDKHFQQAGFRALLLEDSPRF